jgi:Baculovirus F protein
MALNVIWTNAEGYSQEQLSKGLVFMPADKIAVTGETWNFLVEYNFTEILNSMETGIYNITSVYSEDMRGFNAVTLSQPDKAFVKYTESEVRILEKRARAARNRVVEIINIITGTLYLSPQAKRKIEAERATTSTPQPQATDNPRQSAGRQRRALFDGVGSLLHFLFGTGSPGQFSKISEALDRLRENNEHLAQSANLRMSIIPKLHTELQHAAIDLNTIKDHIVLTGRQLNALNEHRLAFENKTIGSFVYLSSIMTTVSALRNVVEQHEKFADDFYVAFHSLQQHSVDPFILPFKTFWETEEKASEILHIHKMTFLAKNGDGNVQSIYNLAKVNTLIKGEILKIFISWPIVRNDLLFNLYQPVPFPARMPNGKGFFKIVPAQEYLAVSNDKRYYFTLSQQEYDLCHKNVFTVCHPRRQIISRTKQHCLMALLRGDTTVANQKCKVMLCPKIEPLFLRSDHIDTYLYNVPNKTHLDAVCTDPHTAENIPTELEGVGSLTVPMGCRLTTDDYTILGGGVLTVGSDRRNFPVEFPSTGTLPTLAFFSYYNGTMPYINVPNNFDFTAPELFASDVEIDIRHVMAKWPLTEWDKLTADTIADRLTGHDSVLAASHDVDFWHLSLWSVSGLVGLCVFLSMLCILYVPFRDVIHYLHCFQCEIRRRKPQRRKSQSPNLSRSRIHTPIAPKRTLEPRSPTIARTLVQPHEVTVLLDAHRLPLREVDLARSLSIQVDLDQESDTAEGPSAASNN